MEIKMRIPLLFLLLVALAHSQSPHHRSYDWRTTGGALGDWPKLTSLLPYAPAAPTASSPDHHPAQPYHHPSYPKDSLPYADDSSSAYSQEYHPYAEVPQSLSSYESYHDPRDEELNMTMARVGGFAGSGDTKGFGAYDFPKNRPRQQEFRHPDAPPHHPQRHPQMDPELEELMRISKQRSSSHYHSSRDPVLVHPLPPPL